MDSNRRRFFADEIATVANLQTPGLVDALATVPREAFLPQGPWLVRAEGDGGGASHTPDDDPAHVYRNCSIAIDASRQLFNGAPGFVAAMIDALALTPGARVLHVGAGLGYYTALMAHVVGEGGRVVAIEIDPDLASGAKRHLEGLPWVEVRVGDATQLPGESFDAIFVSAGVTHPLPAWLAALAPGGRIVVPLTITMPAMGPLGKGVYALFTKTSTDLFTARVLAVTMIYSAVGLRDEALNKQLGQTMMRGPVPTFTSLRTDAHAATAACWMHTEHFCLWTANG